MTTLVDVSIHPSVFPEAAHTALVAGLRARRIPHGLHYGSVKQSANWLAVHRAFSPWVRDPACRALYEIAFAETAVFLPRAVAVVGLGCGSGEKDAALLRAIVASGRSAAYLPGDVSVSLVLLARENVSRVVGVLPAKPLVADLSMAGDLPAVLREATAESPCRLFALFGVVPNFEPAGIFPLLRECLGRDDFALVSANLAPGADYRAGVESVLPQYDNAPTRRWLLITLTDLGFEADDGRLRFTTASDPAAAGLERIEGAFELGAAREIDLGGGKIPFRAGESIRLLFSYRYSTALFVATADRFGLEVIRQWISASGDEGLFLLRPA